MFEVTCALDVKALLGEGALWDSRERVLYWVDITGQHIHRFDPATGLDEAWATPEIVGSLAVQECGNLVVAMEGGFYEFAPSTQAFRHILDPEAALSENCFNDGKPDRNGRFWAGSMHGPKINASGGLYRLDQDSSCHRVIDGIICSNSLCWSPDSRLLYYADSARHIVWVWDFEPEHGTVSHRRVFVELTAADGEPDGATVDSEGHVWIAHWKGWRVVRYDPAGRVEQTIELPVQLPTCPAFGGNDLDILYITSARIGLTEAEIVAQPQAGGFFSCRPGVRGIAEKRVSDFAQAN